MHDLAEKVAGQYDLQPGQMSQRHQLGRDELSGQLRQRRAKHDNIRTDLSDESKGGDAIGCRCHDVTDLLEQTDQRRAQPGVMLDNQRHALMLRDRRSHCSSSMPNLPLSRRLQEVNGR